MKRLVFLAIGVLSTLFVLAQPQKVVADKIIGVVGDRIILQSDISNAIADAARRGTPVPAGAECQVMEQAMVSKILMLQALKDSIPVSEEEIEAELDQRIRYFINAYGTQEALENVAGKTIYQIKDDARESVRESKLAEAMQQKIVSSVRITPAEVKEYFDRIPVDSLPFFETEVEIGQIVLYPKAAREMEKYVADELANYKRQVELKLASFDQLARMHTEDPGSKDRGGQYQINRKEKTWDPAFMAAAFRLKEGEISAPFKSKFGWHIIQMESRNGDDAIVRHILRIPPVTDTELNAGITKLDSIRAKVVAGTMDFSAAAGKYTEDETAKFAGPFITSRDGDTYLTIDELDKSIVTELDKLKVGEISQPMSFVDERGRQAVRILFLKTRTEPHRMNLRDDYNKIAEAALQEKKMLALDKWFTKNINNFYIMIDASLANCEQLKKWQSDNVAASKGF